MTAATQHDMPATASAPFRIDGLDAARGIAVLGMVGAHVGNDGERASEGGVWLLQFTHGFPSALFAVLAGISMTLMLTSRGRVPARQVSDTKATTTRAKIATRALLLIALGTVLTVPATMVDVVLANLGLMMLLACLALRWKLRWLLVGAAICVAVGREVAEFLLGQMAMYDWAALPVIDKFWSFHYPAVAWMGYVFVGLALGRVNWRSPRIGYTLLGGGLIVGIACRGLSAVLLGGTLLEPESEYFSWATVEPHTYTPLEMTQNLGIACAVIGLCLVLARVARWLIWPLMAAGSMALTLYVAHLVVIARVGIEMVQEPSNLAYAVLVVALVGFACLWKVTLGAGPLERVLTWASNASARAWSKPVDAPREDPSEHARL